MMKTLKLGPIRLNSSKATELAELSVILPCMEEVSLASDLEEEVTMQTLNLGSMSLTSINTSEKLPPMGHVGCASNFGKMVMGLLNVLKQGGRWTVGNLKPNGVKKGDSIQSELECGQEKNVTSCH
ncbi:hypothetical protein J1N35_037409 [Gossypium stocksii]|uniref:Uncharacterized protein n=1 Tax=Gossypium stocksii TaxID=47602 RepID=A0A9D3ZLU5_9ROSI|nr:hypothetical protein J1N35_037409 [Gossypium stocksii]